MKAISGSSFGVRVKTLYIGGTIPKQAQGFYSDPNYPNYHKLHQWIALPGFRTVCFAKSGMTELKKTGKEW